MSIEKQTPSSSRSLSRGERFRRRVVAPTVVILGSTAAVAALHSSSSADREPQAEIPKQAVEHVVITGEFKEGETPQETAMHLIKMAVENGTYKAFSRVGVSEDTDVLEAVGSLPVFDQATEALNEAGYGDVLPDAGDKLKLGLDVTADDEENLSYEVTDAEIIDLPNNQQ